MSGLRREGRAARCMHIVCENAARHAAVRARGKRDGARIADSALLHPCIAGS